MRSSTGTASDTGSRPPPPWVSDAEAALLTDLYQLTMVRAYFEEGMEAEAVFSLYFRSLPDGRNYALACGLEDVLRYLEGLRFSRDALDYLASREEFSREFVDWLGALRFTGDVDAVAEGTPVFPEEPLLEVTAPIAQGQLVESFLMNQVHLQTVLASKAARLVTAARDRPVVDFALRRMHGTDASLKGARAFHVAGVAATSNVLAGRIYGLPVTGTMAHSYVQSHDSEIEAFRAFARTYPETILLVDTYDTLEGVGNVVRLARELGGDFRVRAIRLDSGDLAQLARESRRMLDEAGLDRVEIFASGGLDETEVARLVDSGAPIDGFGVGTRMGAATDAPTLDMAYKLTSYAGEGRLKLSPGKPILPGPKQVHRFAGEGRDLVSRRDEEVAGSRPLLRRVMSGGERTAAGRKGLEEARARAREEIDGLPERVRALEPAVPPYRVDVSEDLKGYQCRVAAGLGAAASNEEER